MNAEGCGACCLQAGTSSYPSPAVPAWHQLVGVRLWISRLLFYLPSNFERSVNWGGNPSNLLEGAEVVPGLGISQMDQP